MDNECKTPIKMQESSIIINSKCLICYDMLYERII